MGKSRKKGGGGGGIDSLFSPFSIRNCKVEANRELSWLLLSCLLFYLTLFLSNQKELQCNR